MRQLAVGVVAVALVLSAVAAAPAAEETSRDGASLSAPDLERTVVSVYPGFEASIGVTGLDVALLRIGGPDAGYRVRSVLVDVDGDGDATVTIDTASVRNATAGVSVSAGDRTETTVVQRPTEDVLPAGEYPLSLWVDEDGDGTFEEEVAVGTLVVDPSVALTADPGRVVDSTLEVEPGQVTVSGEVALPDGTRVEVRLRNAGGPHAFTTTEEAVVGDGAFTAGFNLSSVPTAAALDGVPFDVTVVAGDRRLLEMAGKVVLYRPEPRVGWTPAVPLVGERVTFDASNSTDVDGRIVRYRWDVDADGTVEGTGPRPNLRFESAGEHRVRLRVVDDDGLVANRTVAVSANLPPEAKVTHEPDRPEPRERVTFDGGVSTDPNGEIARYRWDLDGDDTFETSGPTTTWTFSRPGLHRVVLAVTDDVGSTSRRRLGVLVGPPVVSAEGNGSAGGPASVTVRLANRLQQPVTVEFVLELPTGVGASGPSSDGYRTGRYEGRVEVPAGETRSVPVAVGANRSDDVTVTARTSVHVEPNDTVLYETSRVVTVRGACCRSGGLPAQGVTLLVGMAVLVGVALAVRWRLVGR